MSSSFLLVSTCPLPTHLSTLSSTNILVYHVLFFFSVSLFILHLHHCPPSLFLYICPSSAPFTCAHSVFICCVRHVLFLHLCPMSSPYVSVHHVFIICLCLHCILSTPQSHPSSTSLSTLSLFNLCPPCPPPIYLSSVN